MSYMNVYLHLNGLNNLGQLSDGRRAQPGPCMRITYLKFTGTDNDREKWCGFFFSVEFTQQRRHGTDIHLHFSDFFSQTEKFDTPTRRESFTYKPEREQTNKSRKRNNRSKTPGGLEGKNWSVLLPSLFQSAYKICLKTNFIKFDQIHKKKYNIYNM